MSYDGKECEIIITRERNDKIYYDILLPERNVELSSLIPINEELKEKSYAIYSRDDYIEIVLVNKIDFMYKFAFIQIYKSNVPSSFILY